MLVASVTQVPLHKVVPPVQAHWPETQLAFGPHALSHAPQL